MPDERNTEPNTGERNTGKPNTDERETDAVDLDGFPYHDGELTHGREPAEVLLTEIIQRARNGEQPSLEEYTAKYPALADKLREMYPLVAAMEHWQRRTEAGLLHARLQDEFRVEQIGNCRIVRELGRGGMGVVFEAVHQTLRRRVAVKLLPWRSDKHSHQSQRFEREARIASSLQHRNIVPVLEFGESDGYFYYVMPFVEGVGLDWIIGRLQSAGGIVYADEIAAMRSQREAAPSRAIPAPAAAGSIEPVSEVDTDAEWTVATHDAVEMSSRSLSRNSWVGFALIGLQAADALRYAHANSMIHRDIKPANILVDRKGRVWITDFGLAQPIGSEGTTGSDDLAGTPRYMAPERFQGHFDERCDIYALGITLYELVTRQPAFDEENRTTLIKKITSDSPAPPRTIHPEIPRAFEAIVTKAIARDPAKRYQTAGEMLGDLVRFLNRQSKRGNPNRFWRKLTRWFR